MPAALLLCVTVLVAACGGGPSTNPGTITATQKVAGLEVLNAISCPTTDWCEAVGATAVNGEGAAVSISQGRPGARHLVPYAKELTAVSCSSTSSCEAVGMGGGHGVLVAIRNGSPSSTQAVVGMSTFSSLSCSGGCLGSGRSQSVGAIASGPSAVLTVPGTTSVNGIDCWQSESCTAVASTSNGRYNDVLVSLDAGRLSPLQVVPPGTSTFSGIACGGPARCVAVGRGASKVGRRVGQQAVVVSVQYGGPTKLVHLRGTSTTTLQSVSCPSTTFCEVVGNAAPGGASGTGPRGVFLAVNDGTPGPLKSVSGQGLQLSGISCPSTGVCMVVGENQTARTAEVLTLTTG